MPHRHTRHAGVLGTSPGDCPSVRETGIASTSSARAALERPSRRVFLTVGADLCFRICVRITVDNHLAAGDNPPLLPGWRIWQTRQFGEGWWLRRAGSIQSRALSGSDPHRQRACGGYVREEGTIHGGHKLDLARLPANRRPQQTCPVARRRGSTRPQTPSWVFIWA